MAISVKDFLDLVKKEKGLWTNYCEILILRNGMIELARPCHQEKLIEYCCEAEEITREEFIKAFPKHLLVTSFLCERYSIISVWFNRLEVPSQINRFQQRTIDILKQNKLISKDPTYVKCTEYSWYLNDLNENKNRYEEINKLLNVHVKN